MSADPCRGAESLLQPYLDRVLTEAEVARVDGHLQRVQLLQRPVRLRAQPAQRGQECCCEEPVPAGFVERLRRRCSAQA